MNPPIKRRSFLIQSSQAGMACCAMMFASKMMDSPLGFHIDEGEKPDPEKLTYCGFECSRDCQFLKASLENNLALKKEVYDTWKIKERYDIDFDEKKIFCYGCKPKDKPEGVVLKNCTVRSCVIEKEIDCCIECNELTDCEKDLWTRFPDFKKHVIELQEEYQTA